MGRHQPRRRGSAAAPPAAVACTDAQPSGPAPPATRPHIGPVRPPYVDPIPALKRQLAAAIVDRIGDRDQYVVGPWLGIDGARVSNIRHGQLDRFSLQALVRMLAHLGDEIRIEVTSYRELHQRELRQILADHEERMADWRSRRPFAPQPRAASGTMPHPRAASGTLPRPPAASGATPRSPAGASPCP